MKDTVPVAKVDQFVIDFVRNLRQAKQLTQEDIANILHLSKSFVRDVESSRSRAKYNLVHINALADYFNISPQEFLPAKPFPVVSASSKTAKTKIAAKVSRPTSKKIGTKKISSKPAKK